MLQLSLDLQFIITTFLLTFYMNTKLNAADVVEYGRKVLIQEGKKEIHAREPFFSFLIQRCLPVLLFHSFCYKNIFCRGNEKEKKKIKT